MGVDAIMLVRVQREMTDKEIDHLSWRCMEALGSGHFYKRALFRCDGRLDQEELNGTTLLEAGLWSRHYGDGYERGDFPFLFMLAEWLTTNTGGTVFYGTDHGDNSELWSDIAERLKAHWLEHGHVPYSFTEPEPRFRKTCPECNEVMSQNGGGGKRGEYAFLHCLGCDLEMRTSDGGKTWISDRDRLHIAVDVESRRNGEVIADWASERFDATDLYAAFLVMQKRVGGQRSDPE